LRLARRRSLDIDLVRDNEFDAEDLLQELETDGLVVSNVRTKPNTLWFELAGVPVNLMRFPYPCVAPSSRPSRSPCPRGFPRRHRSHEIEAVASRGARKDFYDLYFICQKIGGLSAALAAFEARFASAHPDIIHRLKALTYFTTPKREPEPALLVP
jgi:hypothetical protein